jgi:hypothetical protein
MKFINIRADGSVCDTMAGVVLPYNERTAPVYEMIKSSLMNPRPRSGRKRHEQNLQTPPEAYQGRKDSGQQERP